MLPCGPVEPFAPVIFTGVEVDLLPLIIVVTFLLHIYQPFSQVGGVVLQPVVGGFTAFWFFAYSETTDFTVLLTSVITVFVTSVWVTFNAISFLFTSISAVFLVKVSFITEYSGSFLKSFSLTQAPFLYTIRTGGVFEVSIHNIFSFAGLGAVGWDIISVKSTRVICPVAIAFPVA